jgi:uncharacterized membrane protein YdcZ (DUF606 family)
MRCFGKSIIRFTYSLPEPKRLESHRLRRGRRGMKRRFTQERAPAASTVCRLTESAFTYITNIVSSVKRRFQQVCVRPGPCTDAVRHGGWLGADCGAAMFTAIPVIGTAAKVGLTVAGQQIASVFVDRHGWLRLPRRPITPMRLAGVLTLLAGVALVQLS